MGEHKTVFKFFSIMKYKEEEKYLSHMHKTGWKLASVSMPGLYRFTKCTPEDVVYQLDYNLESLNNKNEYVKMFSDCGWEYLFDFVGYSYFRKPTANMQGEEEIFCDDESRLDMMKQVFKGRMMPMLIIFCACILPQLFTIPRLYGDIGPVQKVMFVLLFVIFLLYMLLFLMFGTQFYQYERVVYRDAAGSRFKYICFLAVWLLLAGGVISGFLYLNRSRETIYTLQERRNGYEIEAEYFNETVAQAYELRRGDMIQVKLVQKSGELQIVMGQKGEEPIFTGIGKEVGDFSVEIQEDGEYTISCTGKGAVGSYDFEIKRFKTDQ